MIYFLIGEVELLEKNFVVINNNNIGYQIKISDATHKKILDLISNDRKKKIKFYTFMTIKDEIIFLYGFLSREELEIFNQLLSVSGIGPKAAMNILANITHENILSAIANENINLLSSVPGIGKKTAQRLILELKDKINKLDLNISADNKNFLEAQEALFSLGYSQSDIIKITTQIKNQNQNLTTEEIIKQALKLFAIKK
ncbi:MAG: Holliday junction branch migration protein RuvA [Firmicutes bacterium]|nr:Holliday junction branch migration protein RuvA [Bacillota bacterium]